MLVNLNIPWVIICHSARRLILDKSNEFVGDIIAYALSQRLRVIACIGETLEQRESGSTMAVVAAQTKSIAEYIAHWSIIVLACEPVWAISTKVATPAQAQEVHNESRKWVQENAGAKVAASTRNKAPHVPAVTYIEIVFEFQFLGSENEGNCKELAAQPGMDGFLVGGASVKVMLLLLKKI